MRVAALYEQREITYRDLRDETIRLAESLNALGVSAGERVAILLHDSPEFIASFVGIISLGAIAVPINMALRIEEQRFILKDCGARALIIEADAFEALLGEGTRSRRQEAGSRATGGAGADSLSPLQKPLRPLRLDLVAGAASLPELKDVLLVRGDRSDQPAPSVTANVQLLEQAARESLAGGLPVASSEDAPAFILYTSGSTGEPKGAVHRQADIACTNETFCREALRLGEGDRLFSSSRLPFAYGLGNSFTFPLLNGCTTILCREKPLPEVISRVFTDYRPTIFFGVPVVYRMLLDHHRNERALECSSLRLCISAGEALPATLGEEWQRTFGVEVLDGIGSTEMLHMFMSNHAGEVRYGSSGKMLQEYEARLVDHEGNPTQEGETGNLWIRGGSASIGYWRRPEATARTFVDGWVRTGDLYRRDKDGFWWHMGRSDDCFKPTGQWVSPVEVEGALLRRDGIRQAAVVEGFDEHGLSCVCAFVLAKDASADQSLLEKELRAHIENALPRFKQPRRYIFVQELPYTATGKIQRFKLREQLRAQRATL